MKDNDNILNAGGNAYSGRKRSPTLSVVFPDKMLKKIQKQAAKNGISTGEQVRRMCAKAMGIN